MSTMKILIFFLFSSISLFAQKSIFDNYNHIIIPTKFMIQETENEFQLNSLVRYLFKEEGFTVFMDSELLPDEYASNPCSGLRVELDKKFNIIQTTIFVNLYDCKNSVVFSSKGTSREKEFKKGYQEAIRNAFLEIESANFSLVSSTSEQSVEEDKVLTMEERNEMRKQVVRNQSEVYEHNGELFYFFPVEEKIHIYGSNAYDILAKLTPINEEMFIYNSDEIDGVMTKKADGSFDLEYREAASKETKVVHYTFVETAKE